MNQRTLIMIETADRAAEVWSRTCFAAQQNAEYLSVGITSGNGAPNREHGLAGLRRAHDRLARDVDTVVVCDGLQAKGLGQACEHQRSST